MGLIDADTSAVSSPVCRVAFVPGIIDALSAARATRPYEPTAGTNWTMY